jgi:hypothetical protein
MSGLGVAAPLLGWRVALHRHRALTLHPEVKDWPRNECFEPAVAVRSSNLSVSTLSSQSIPAASTQVMNKSSTYSKLPQ